jgi:hypothetical protein
MKELDDGKETDYVLIILDVAICETTGFRLVYPPEF